MWLSLHHSLTSTNLTGEMWVSRCGRYWSKTCFCCTCTCSRVAGSFPSLLELGLPKERSFPSLGCGAFPSVDACLALLEPMQLILCSVAHPVLLWDEACSFPTVGEVPQKECLKLSQVPFIQYLPYLGMPSPKKVILAGDSELRRH